MNKEIEWFCYHLVSQGLLNREQCEMIGSALTSAGVEVNLATFAQVVIDNEMCSDLDSLQSLVDMSVEEARSIGFPPESMFEDEGTSAEEQEAVAPSPPAPSATTASTQDQTPVNIEDVAPRDFTAGEEWMQGWPVVNQAKDLDPEGAIKLLNGFLQCARAAGCSDVHISAGAFPFVRQNQNVYLVGGQEIVSLEASEMLNLSPLTKQEREKFDKEQDLDYSYAITNEDRYRTNVMRQRLGIAGSYRVIDNRIRTLEELGFPRPDVIEKLTTHHQGLILVTGSAGCGKSTTLASLVEYINKNRHDHIITVEDPIEVVFQPKGCNITQRGLHYHTKSFSNALRAALREDPDIIVIGELRDLETIEMAISSSETGHLVIGTLHTGSAPSTMDRILDVFPPNHQAQIRSMVAESLKGVICQQLVSNHDGSGVVLATEIMLGTLAVSNLIREGKTYQLDSTIQTGIKMGMQSMEQSYFDLYIRGDRTFDQTLPLVKTAELVRQMQANEARKNADAAGVGKKRGWFK